MYITISLKNLFGWQKSYGNTSRLKTFDTEKKNSVTVSTPGRHQTQKLLQYDERPSYMILWKQGNFCESKLLWVYNDSLVMMMIMMEAKSCGNISQKLLYCSPRYISTYIGTPNFLVKVLWVYSHF